MNKQSSRGMAGTVVVVLIMGLLVSISTAYIKMVQTESQIQNIVDHSDRALDAAFSGVNYAMAVAQSNKEMFISGNERLRNYFVRVGYVSTDWSGINQTLTVGNFPNLIPTDWFYLDDNLSLFDYGETGNDMAPYLFRVISYPLTATTAPYDPLPAAYMIKAQGLFRIYDSSLTNIDREYKAQIIAECEVNFSRRVIKLKRWRYMPFESDLDFIKAVRY